MIEYFRCVYCGAIISVEQDETIGYPKGIIKFPSECHEEQGGCGRRISDFMWVEQPKPKVIPLAEQIKEVEKYDASNKNISIIKKWCWVCKRELPLNDFSKDVSKKYGRRDQCKQCQNNYYNSKKVEPSNPIKGNKLYDFESVNTWEKSKQKEKLFKKGLLPCPVCKRVLPIEKFYYKVNKKFEHSSPCKKCIGKFYKKNKEKLSEQHRKNYLKNKEKKVESNLNHLIREEQNITPESQSIQNDSGSKPIAQYEIDCINLKNIITNPIIKEEQTQKEERKISDGEKPDAIPVRSIPESIDERNVDAVLNNPDKRKKFFLFRSKEL